MNNLYMVIISGQCILCNNENRKYRWISRDQLGWIPKFPGWCTCLVSWNFLRILFWSCGIYHSIFSRNLHHQKECNFSQTWNEICRIINFDQNSWSNSNNKICFLFQKFISTLLCVCQENDTEKEFKSVRSFKSFDHAILCWLVLMLQKICWCQIRNYSALFYLMAEFQKYINV